MSAISIKQLLEAGVHFGHQTSRWNPKMKEFIFGERNGIHIVDLQQTLRLFKEAVGFLYQLGAEGKEVLFVGTKRQAQEAIEEDAKRCGMHFVTNRWLGGLLTNFETIQNSIKRYKQLETMKADGSYKNFSKKEVAKFERERKKLDKNLRGIREMESLPDTVFIIDTDREAIAVKEASRLGIPVIAVVDTNCNPDLIDYVIPGNDDALRSVKLFTSTVADAIQAGRSVWEARLEEERRAREEAEKAEAEARAAREAARAARRAEAAKAAAEKAEAERVSAKEAEREKAAAEEIAEPETAETAPEPAADRVKPEPGEAAKKAEAKGAAADEAEAAPPEETKPEAEAAEEQPEKVAEAGGEVEEAPEPEAKAQEVTDEKTVKPEAEQVEEETAKETASSAEAAAEPAEEAEAESAKTAKGKKVGAEDAVPPAKKVAKKAGPRKSTTKKAATGKAKTSTARKSATKKKASKDTTKPADSKSPVTAE